MLFNNIDTTGIETTLTPGIYYFNLFNSETVDPLDIVRVTGNNYYQWRLEDDSEFFDPFSGNEFTLNADNIDPKAIVVFKVFENTTFNIRTDDTFEFPNDDTPTNPMVDLEILQAGDYSVVASDFIGSVDNNVLSTGEGAINSDTISSAFFNNQVDLTLYGVEGTAALWVTEPGWNIVNVNYDDDYGAVFFWDGVELNQLSLTDGDNTLLLNAQSDEWGFVVLDALKTSDVNTFTVESVDWINGLPYQALGDNVSLYTAGDVNSADLINNIYELGTGTGDYSISTLGYRLFDDRSFFEGLGTEGSTIALSGLTPGEYQFDVLLDAIDSNDNDTLLVYNGILLEEVTNSSVGNSFNNTIEVPYGQLTFVALDSTTKTGTTEFSIQNLTRTGNLPYELIQLNPNSGNRPIPSTLGDTQRLNPYQYLIGTGTGDRSVSTLGNNLAGSSTFFNQYGSEGSYITLEVDNGVYNFNAISFKADSVNNDAFYAFNGKDLVLIADTNTDNINNSIDVIYGELSFIALDVGEKVGTTDFVLSNLTRTGDLTYSPPVLISLTPDVFNGDVDFYDTQTRINNGTGDRAVSTLTNELGIDLEATASSNSWSLPTEGSYATWNNLENGTYEITYSLYTSEDDTNHDDIYFYDGTSLELFDSRSSATIQSSATRWVSDITTAEVVVTNGELTLITLDTFDKSGTTQLRITKIEKLAGNVNNNNDNPIDTTSLGLDPAYSSWFNNYDSNQLITTPETIGLNNTTDIIEFSTSTNGLVEFTITPGDYNVSLISMNNNSVEPMIQPVSYSPQIGNKDYLIDAFTYDLPAGDYKIFIDSSANFTVEYQYSLYSESEAIANGLFYFSEGFDSTNVGDESHVAVIHPVYGYEEGYYTKKYPNGLTITEINDLEEYIWEEIDAYAPTDINRFSVTASEANLYNLFFEYEGNGNTDSSDVSLLKNGVEILNFNTADAFPGKLSTEGTYEGITLTQELTEGDYEFVVNYTGTDLGFDKLGSYSLFFDVNDEPTEPYYQEPPFPILQNNKDLGNDPLTGLNLGTLKPYETDTGTGVEYNNGYVYGSYHLGASYINETIGEGSDVSDWISFNIQEETYLNFFHSNAIAEILDVNQQVVVGSNGSYSGNLQALLTPGDYYLNFSSDATSLESYNAAIYLSNSDPNYAD